MKVSSFVRSFSLDSPEDTFESWSVTAKQHIATAVSKFIDEVLLLFVQRDEVIVKTPTARIQDLEVNVIDESGCSRCSLGVMEEVNEFFNRAYDRKPSLLSFNIIDKRFNQL